jgi:hypothetical protein
MSERDARGPEEHKKEYSLPDAAGEELTFFRRGNFGFLNHLRRTSIRPMLRA